MRASTTTTAVLAELLNITGGVARRRASLSRVLAFARPVEHDLAVNLTDQKSQLTAETESVIALFFFIRCARPNTHQK